jgi:hypothetical protein
MSPMKGQPVSWRGLRNEGEIVREPSVDPAFERRTLAIPLARSSRAIRALLAWLDHEQ